MRGNACGDRINDDVEAAEDYREYRKGYDNE